MNRQLDNSGFALPLALFGMVAISLLLTSALMTSATEVALSEAHQEGTRALYAADGALENFVARRAEMDSTPERRIENGSYLLARSWERHRIAVAKLFQTEAVEVGEGFERTETYSLVAEPETGLGRAVGALLEVTRRASLVDFNVDSGLTLLADASIGGSASLSDGIGPGALCDSASAPAAVRYADGAIFNVEDDVPNIEGGIVEDDRGAEELAAHVLDGRSLEELTEFAHIRFGPMFGEPAFSGFPRQTASDMRYRWGCPGQMVAGCGDLQSAFFPTVAIDAGGGTVDLRGEHGQGILIIRNGGLRLRGDFAYAGIILVEGPLKVTGGPMVEGAVIAFDKTTIQRADGGMGSSGPRIRFNRCQIVEAQKSLTISTLDSAEQRLETSTFAWFEVIR